MASVPKFALLGYMYIKYCSNISPGAFIYPPVHLIYSTSNIYKCTCISKQFSLFTNDKVTIVDQFIIVLRQFILFLYSNSVFINNSCTSVDIVYNALVYIQLPYSHTPKSSIRCIRSGMPLLILLCRLRWSIWACA